MRRVLPLVMAVGCWTGSGEPTQPQPVIAPAPVPRVQGASCEEVADNTHTVVGASDDPSLAGRAEQLAKVILRRCVADGWSMELRRCIAGAKSLDETDGCENLATKEQQEALERELELMENAD